jgi:hypothetical protein
VGVDAGASAATSPADETEQLIARAVELRRHGDDQGALPLLRAAYSRGQSPRAAAQLGFVEQALGFWVDAEDHLAEAATAATDPWILDHVSLLDESLTFVHRHVGMVIVDANVVGAAISVDGVLVGRSPLATPAKAATGERWIEARAPGYSVVATTVTVHAGRTTRIAVTLVDPAARGSNVDSASAGSATARTALGAPMMSAPPASAGAAEANAQALTATPIYRRWWLWTGVAAVLVGIGVAVAATRGSDAYPCGGNGRFCAQ